MKTRPRARCSSLWVSPLLLALATGTRALGQEPPQVDNLTRAGDGAPVCGLGAEFHSGRRAALRERLEHGVFVMRGLANPRTNVTFRQDKNFWWLTGVESPNVALAIDLDSGREVLFVAKPSAFRERWEGEIWDSDDDWVAELTGFEEVAPIGDLLDVVDQMMEGKRGSERQVWTCLSAAIGLSGSYDAARPYVKAQREDELDGRPSREEAFATHLAQRFEVEVEDAWPEMIDIRLVKTPEEVDALRRAARAGALALAEAMRSCRPGLGEWELDSLIEWVQARHGADGPAYSGIVGSGPNSLVLHYNFSARRMRDGEVVLIDFGPEVDHYTTDITRTFPVNGRFSEKQAVIYDVVLKAQLAGIAVAKPGNSMSDVELACRNVILEAGHRPSHGSCHWVGMEVHDPGERRGKLVPGMVFTIEPGVYDKETNIGVRIEDVVVITEDGCEVISRDVPKQRDEIEALMAETGVLDWLDGPKR